MNAASAWAACAVLGVCVAALWTMQAGRASGQHTVEAQASEVLAPARIDVNSAASAELELLPGVGPKLAGAIVEFREQHGPFRAVEDLDQATGIGPSTLERLRERVRFGSAKIE